MRKTDVADPKRVAVRPLYAARRRISKVNNARFAGIDLTYCLNELPKRKRLV